MLEPMMLVKLIHVISSAVLFCGVLSASLFFTLAFRRGGPEIITAMARFCRTGAIVTAAAMVVQPLTGATLIVMQENAPNQPWLISAYILYVVVLASWVGATFILGKVASTPREAVADGKLYRMWAPVSWGSVALVCVIYYLMLVQPALWAHAG